MDYDVAAETEKHPCLFSLNNSEMVNAVTLSFCRL